MNNDNLKPFQPGQSGNPSGKPKGAKHYSTLLKEALELGVEVEINKKKITVDEAELIKQVAKGIAKGNIKFIELAFDRVDGKPNQPITADINIGSLSEMSDEQLWRLLNDSTNETGSEGGVSPA